jgi:ethanolamine utilization protein EutA
MIAHTALDIGARLICLDTTGRTARVEEAGRHYCAELGIVLDLGATLGDGAAHMLTSRMADDLFEAMRGGSPSADGTALLRLDPLAYRGPIDSITFSGGVAEYIYDWEKNSYGDLGGLLAAEIRARIATSHVKLERPSEGIRATVIGASQYTCQVSGSTIFVSPLDVLPLRNVPVIAADLALDQEEIDPVAVSTAIKVVLKRLDLAERDHPVALFVPWRGSATYRRLDCFCRGVADGLSNTLARGHPLVLAGDGDVGGLIGIHCREELKLNNPIVSIDGLELKEFDYIDIGRMLESSGAVPVVIKSLIFPGDGSR